MHYKNYVADHMVDALVCTLRADPVSPRPYIMLSHTEAAPVLVSLALGGLAPSGGNAFCPRLAAGDWLVGQDSFPLVSGIGARMTDPILLSLENQWLTYRGGSFWFRKGDVYVIDNRSRTVKFPGPVLAYLLVHR